MSRRYVCVHGHFYQPPRENPWLESIERQESAHPYHDWNERITAECYAPNAASRIFDDRQRIVEIVNNYSRISFNFGPTLLSWMEEHARVTYRCILDADRESRERYGGHGSAMAQAWGHVIMPLAGCRDKRTQVLWGVRDFQSRFGRDPEGMWLPETAVDIDTLEALAEHGIRFTVLAPRQAAAVRRLNRDDEPWHDVSGSNVDPSRPYLVRLPSGREITVFFYDGPVSRAVAFEELTRNGERLAERLLGVFAHHDRESPRLVHIATDGETFGHHHVHGEMALSYALAKLEETEGIELTNYGQFLEMHPPTWEARIIENSSWSCIHGIERWRSDCGCSTGGSPRWNQEWRRPLREALDGLRQEVDRRFEQDGGDLLRDPWGARNEYIRVVLDRSEPSVDAFLNDHATRELDELERVRALQLLELQRHAMYMYTSCGWFFAEISGIETTQVLAYAARVIQLMEDVFGEAPEQVFLEALERARSNIPEKRNARYIYEQWVRPQRLDLTRVAAHYAIHSVFSEDEGDEIGIHCYRVLREDERNLKSGRSSFVAGWSTFRSAITYESARLAYAAIYTGNHNVLAGVRGFRGTEPERAARQVLEEAFRHGELAKMVRTLDKEFRTPSHSLRSLFRDEQQAVLNQILESSVEEAEELLQDLYERSAPLMRFAAELGVSQPGVFQTAAAAVLRRSLNHALATSPPDLDRIGELLGEARDRGVHLDPEELEHSGGRALEALADAVAEEPRSLERLMALERGADLLLDVDFQVILRGAQNTFYRVLKDHYPGRKGEAEGGDADARRWVELFERVADTLGIAVG